MLEQCTKSKNHQKVVTLHVWEEQKEKVRLNRLSKSGKLFYKYRKEQVERSFADSKELDYAIISYAELKELQNKHCFQL
ncbi:hypothetical protein COC46_16595 [Bacillus sp. AFS041924]|nr:hypothetical protein COC46_16595 [Bacillus sp. AFS041924]